MPDTTVERIVLDAIRVVCSMEPDRVVGLDARLFDGEQLAIDSIGALELLCIIESALGAELDDDDLDLSELATVSDVVDLATRLEDERTDQARRSA